MVALTKDNKRCQIITCEFASNQKQMYTQTVTTKPYNVAVGYK